MSAAYRASCCSSRRRASCLQVHAHDCQELYMTVCALCVQVPGAPPQAAAAAGAGGGPASTSAAPPPQQQHAGTDEYTQKLLASMGQAGPSAPQAVMAASPEGERAAESGWARCCMCDCAAFSVGLVPRTGSRCRVGRHDAANTGQHAQPVPNTCLACRCLEIKGKAAHLGVCVEGGVILLGSVSP